MEVASAQRERHADAHVSMAAHDARDGRVARFTCAFDRRSFSHTAIFQSEYMRVNQTKGLKVMRCFPHCCPHHEPRSNCGAPLHVQVDLDTLTCREYSGDLLVFGRFALADESQNPRVRPGAHLDQQAVLGSIHGDRQPNGTWIESTIVASADKTSWLFELNSNARWFYDWESGVMKSQRFAKHVFEAYVVEPTGGATFRVLCTTRSTPFTVASYRRSKAKHKLSAASDVSNSPIRPLVQDADRSGVGIAATVSHHLPQLSHLHENTSTPTATAPFPIIDQRERTKGYDPVRALAVVFWFMDELKIVDALTIVDDPNAKQHSRLSTKEAAAPTILNILDVFADHQEKDRKDWEQRSMHYVRSLIGELGVWLTSDFRLNERRRQHLEVAFLRIPLRHNALWQTYSAWVQWRVDCIDKWFNHHKQTSLEAVVKDIVAYVDSCGDLTLRNGLECACHNIESDKWKYSFQSYVAQVRDAHVSFELQKIRRKRKHDEVSPVDMSAPMARIGGTWVCDLSRAQVQQAAQMGQKTRLTALLSVWRQLSHLHIVDDVTNQSIAIRSTITGRLTPLSNACNLVLDNRQRVFRMFPSGDATLGHQPLGQHFGDYIGRGDDTHVRLRCFSWPQVPSRTTQPYRWEWWLRRSGPASLSVVLIVSAGEWVQSGFRGQDLERIMGTAGLHDKLACVADWHLLQRIVLEYTR